MKERIHKIIANCGICSRRAAEELIEKGKVLVNGEKATVGQSADIEVDKILVGGKLLKKPVKQYFILNKPEGYETTMSSPQKRRTVFDLMKTNERVVPVGRLDMNSRGLIILTNDGDFANKIMHPKYELEKTYEATVKGKIPKSKLEKLEKGVRIKTGITYPCEIKILKEGKTFMRVSIKIHEGKNRQIREMFKAIGYDVEELVRTNIAFLSLKGLADGKQRRMTTLEVENLKKLMETPNKKPKPFVRDRIRDNKEWSERKKLSNNPPMNSKYKDYKNPRHTGSSSQSRASRYDAQEDKRSLSNDWDGKIRVPVKREYSREGTPPRRSSYGNRPEGRGSYSRDSGDRKSYSRGGSDRSSYSKPRSSGYSDKSSTGREKRTFSRDDDRKSYSRGSRDSDKSYSRDRDDKKSYSKSKDAVKSYSRDKPSGYSSSGADVKPYSRPKDSSKISSGFDYGKKPESREERKPYSRDDGDRKTYARGGAGKKEFSRSGERNANFKSRDSSRSSSSSGSSRSPRRSAPSGDDIIPFDPTRKPKERFKDRLRKEAERKGSKK